MLVEAAVYPGVGGLARPDEAMPGGEHDERPAGRSGQLETALQRRSPVGPEGNGLLADVHDVIACRKVVTEDRPALTVELVAPETRRGGGTRKDNDWRLPDCPHRLLLRVGRAAAARGPGTGDVEEPTDPDLREPASGGSAADRTAPLNASRSMAATRLTM